MANLRAHFQNEELNQLGRLKKTLQENPSLSAKLFLRGLAASGSNALRNLQLFTGRIVGRARHRKHPNPTLSTDDIDHLTNSTAFRKARDQRATADIQCSIVIPVFNKAEFTFQCLRSLLDEIDFNRNEVIVVDNASSDNTALMLSRFGELVTVIRNEENRGFVDACNQGAAAAARGKYLVFLNNDTEVLPGWLNHLVETIESDSAAGAVGSMLIYPEGTIQEAGGIVWNNGEAHHYGWGNLPDDRRYNFAREVDYCSAASLLIRRGLFERLGGFDRRFAPAYYEDVDLCFGVRALGYRVIYQPLSRILHYEGATAGSDVTTGVKHFQIINRQKFVEKWHETLDRDHLPPHPKFVADASHRDRNRPRVIVFDERVPSPDRDAGSLRMFLILKTIARWAHVIFVPYSRPQSIDYERALWKEGIETADATDYRQVLKHANVKAAIVSRPSMASTFIRRIRRANPEAGIVFDMVDTHFLRCQREYEISGNEAVLAESNRYKKLETTLAQQSDIVWSASDEDRQVMQLLVPNKRIDVVPTIHELRDISGSFESREDLLFIGNLAHRPNEDAVVFFVREIFPLLRERLPGIAMDIIGDFSSPAIMACDSADIHIRGYIQDVAPYLRDRRVFVAPLRFGAGIKGKIGEAMAHGIPVVTTTIGAEGFGLTHELDVMIANEPADFAAAVARLYSDQDLWERVAHNGRLRIEKYFTPEVVAETISRSLLELIE
ncbi:MAG TPA: glycosyltransferase [Pyrinomonadaceae bacterium]|nr:glycosyltransferase [Pyrinomonadaceae bacterium]